MNTKTNYFFAIVLIALGVSVYFFALEPFRSEANSLQVSFEQKQTELTETQNKISNYTKLQSELEATSQVKQTTALNAIPLKYDQDTLITTLTEKTAAHSMSLSSISFGQGIQNDMGIYSATLTASLSGDYQRLITFLKAMENEIQRKILIKSISVELGESLGSLTEVRFNLNMETFYQTQ
jgi:hypothetical protein